MHTHACMTTRACTRRAAQERDEEEAEEDEESRQAALAAEVKRHLTAILLEVTDSLFGAHGCFFVAILVHASAPPVPWP